jgi:hypothetical protein
MQVRKQIIELFFIEHVIEFWHVAAAHEDRVSYVLIGRRNSTW